MRITNAESTHEEFQVRSAYMRVLVCDIELEEDVESRIYSEAVFGYGNQRPWATSNRSRRGGT